MNEPYSEIIHNRHVGSVKEFLNLFFLTTYQKKKNTFAFYGKH